MKLENAPIEALDELLELIGIADAKSKIALVDLLRLLIIHKINAAYVLHKHWDKLNTSICEYFKGMDLTDPDARVIQSYHLRSLRMLSNIFLSDAGIDFMQGE
jgi:hypothetical protein